MSSSLLNVVFRHVRHDGEYWLSNRFVYLAELFIPMTFTSHFSRAVLKAWGSYCSGDTVNKLWN